MKIPYFTPWITIQDKKIILKTLNQRWLTNGPTLKKFENNFCDFLNSKYSIGVGNATQALHLAARSLGIGPGDEVIVPTFTFAATANAVIYCGAKPIFVDVDIDTFNILPEEIEKKITKRTKAIIPVHYGGQACDMKEILYISKKHNLSIIEDCAHALGSNYKNKKVGTLGKIGCFSFYATKVITTAEGGMISTNNSDVYRISKNLRSQAMSIQANDREKNSTWKYDIVDLGYNYRLDEIRSSLGISQLMRINKINSIRIKIAKYYDKKIKSIKGISIPATKKDRNHIYHLYTIKINNDYHLNRDELFNKLSDRGIGCSVQYYPLHLMSYYRKKYSLNKNEFPNANILKDQVISLPIYPNLTSKQLNYIISALK